MNAVTCCRSTLSMQPGARDFEHPCHQSAVKRNLLAGSMCVLCDMQLFVGYDFGSAQRAPLSRDHEG